MRRTLDRDLHQDCLLSGQGSSASVRRTRLEHEGEVLEAVVTAKRDKAALKYGMARPSFRRCRLVGG
jgi:hypothetical protein